MKALLVMTENGEDILEVTEMEDGSCVLSGSNPPRKIYVSDEEGIRSFIAQSGLYQILGELFGYAIVEAPQVFTIHYEVALWYTDVKVQPGRYPILKCNSRWTGEEYYKVTLPGKVVASNQSSLLCGNIVDHIVNKDVGRAAEVTEELYLPHIKKHLSGEKDFYKFKVEVL